jgi:PTH1 family peptidyl-tRNA hydrolase
MKIVVGLGNPGEEYVGTRHNAGFEAVEVLARRNGVALAHDRRLRARVGRGRVREQDVLVVEPLAFMNLSGPVVQQIVREREASLAELLVVCDDYHLPVAELRVRATGSAGGHNGLKSLIGALSTHEFPRLRIGIGQAPPGGAVDFVLTRFRPAEREPMAQAYERAADCVEDWCVLGVDAAMNRYNRKSATTEE